LFFIIGLTAIGFTISAYVLGTPIVDSVRNLGCVVGSLVSFLLTGNGAS